MSEFEFMVHLLSAWGTELARAKVEARKNQLQRCAFLRFLNVYVRFILDTFGYQIRASKKAN